jgi:molybdopterin converting factor small subunit
MGNITQKFLAAVEAAVKKMIEDKSDEIVEKLLSGLAEKIPGKFDDAFIEGLKPEVKADIKAFLLEQAEKIS